MFSTLIISCTFVHSQGTLKELDKDYGFRNAKFEMPITSFKNLKEYSIEPTTYIITTDDLKLDGYDLEYIQYGFTEDYERLSDITIQPDGAVNCAGVLKYFQKIYGEGQKIDGIEGEMWVGEKATLFYGGDFFVIQCNKYLNLI